MRTRSRSGSTHRFLRARAAALVALTLLIGLAVPVAEASPLPPPDGGAAAPAVPGPAHRVDVRNPGVAGLTLRHPYSARPYRVVEVSPGIGVTNQLSPASGTPFDTDGTLLSDDRFQLLTDRVSDVIDQIRSTPTGSAALKAIPNLLGPSAKGVWTERRPDGAQGRTSAVQIVFAEGADTAAGANGEQAVTEGPAGSGSMIVVGRGTWSDMDAGDYAWFDPETGAARIVRPVESVQHELMHAIADLGGGTPAMRSVDVPTAAWREWPVAGEADSTATIEVPLAELFTQGGPLGLTAAREALTSPGPSGAAPEFTTEEFPSIAVDPWMLRANRYATDRFLAGDTPAFEREGWLSAAAARLSIAIRPPTEVTFSRERGVPGRPEYQPSAVHVDGGYHTLIPLSIARGSTPWDAPDLRQWPGVAPAHGTWETPHLAAPTAPSENTPDGSTAPGGPEGSEDGLPRVHCAACSATAGRLLSPKEAEAFEARVVAETASASRGVEDLRRGLLKNPVGDAFRQVRGPESDPLRVWERYPSLVAGMREAGAGFRFADAVSPGSEGLGSAWLGLDLMRLLEGDHSAMSLVSASTDLLTTVAPAFGSRVASSAGAAGAVVGLVTSLVAFSRGGSETDLIVSMAGLLLAFEPELSPLMLFYPVLSAMSHPDPLEESMNAGQQMVVAYHDWSRTAFEKIRFALADSMVDAVRDRMEEVRYRAGYLQAKVDLADLAAGHDPTTGGGDGSQEEKRRIRELMDRELVQIVDAGQRMLDEGLDALVDRMNNGSYFTDFRARWAKAKNDDGGVTIGLGKHHVDLDQLPTTNPRPVSVDAYTTPLGSVRTLTQSRYRHALDALPLWDPSRNAFAVPMLTEQEVLETVGVVQRDWGFTGPVATSREPVETLTVLTGTGTPGSFIEVVSPTTRTTVCGVTKVNAIGLWSCSSAHGFQEPGLTATYELHSSAVATGGFTPTGKEMTVTTGGAPVKRPVLEWGGELRVEGRTVLGTVTSGATVRLERMPATSLDVTGAGAPASDTVTAADGHFRLDAASDAPGGSTRLVAALDGHTIAERIVIDSPPSRPLVPTPIPETVADSPIRITRMTATSIDGVVPAGQKIQIRVGEDPVLLPIQTDGTGAFHVALPAPLRLPETVVLRSWPTEAPWSTSTRTITWTGDPQQPAGLPDVHVH